jgi:DNA-binding GntR family transcriptional regulator
MQPASSAPTHGLPSDGMPVDGRGALKHASDVRLDRPSTSDLIAMHVRCRIFDGDLRPGQRIRQNTFARDYGVSRIPVCEAFIALDREGWVTTSSRGTIVAAFDEDTIRDHYAIQGFVYALAARRAVGRSSDEGLADLTLAEQCVATAGDPGELDAANQAYLATLFRVGGSWTLAAALRRTTELVPGNVFEVIPRSQTVHRRHVVRITSAVCERDAAGAVDACVRLMDDRATLVIELARTRGLFGSRDTHEG